MYAGQSLLVLEQDVIRIALNRKKINAVIPKRVFLLLFIMAMINFG